MPPSPPPDVFTHTRHYQLLLLIIYSVCLFALLAFAYVPALSAIDRWLFHMYLFIGAGLIITSKRCWIKGVQIFHILFIAMFVFIPLLATAPCLLALHMAIVVSTLALRAECGWKCPVNTMECHAEKLCGRAYLEMINFNVVFWCSGAVTLMRWLWTS